MTRMWAKLLGGGALLAGMAAFGATFGAGAIAPGAAPPVIYADQGSKWTAASRAEFYKQDQGSQLIKLAWLQALQRPDGTAFLQDKLTRYGYLLENAGDALPVGFTVAGKKADAQFVGMTCSACHTREINVDGQRYRIDGGPALVDFQQFLTDLDHAVGDALASNESFDAFARRVIGPNAGVGEIALLKQDVTFWYSRQHPIFAKALPHDGWGIGRLDAVSMIFDRVSGIDIGTSPNGVIEANIQVADAPVRYPFVWDAPKQDRTQWPGFADNGDALLGLARNLGEVYGVFADYRPRKNRLLGYDHLEQNSANFPGLAHAETLVSRIGPPAWPWAIDAAAKARGAALFQSNCASCHGIQKGKTRFVPFAETWKTPMEDVGTDIRQYDILARTADTGVLKGALYGLGKKLQPQDKQFNILAAAVIGSILDDVFLRQRILPEMFGSPLGFIKNRVNVKTELNTVYHTEAAEKAGEGVPHPYEARVLRGIWSTAPYLHNGSVPTLWDLLQPPEHRQAAFAVGAAYDTKNVGLAAAQTGLSGMRITTGCEDLKSGNSRCGHVYGTKLSDAEKWDLLEYLKAL